MNPRRTLKPSEHAMQTAVCDWWKWACKGYKLPERTLFAIPNASKQKDTGRFWRAREGLRAGVPDLFLAYVLTHGSFRAAGGLFIEMKAKPNKPSVEQLNMMAMLRLNGYRAVVCYSADEAIAAIKEYLR